MNKEKGLLIKYKAELHIPSFPPMEYSIPHEANTQQQRVQQPLDYIMVINWLVGTTIGRRYCTIGRKQAMVVTLLCLTVQVNSATIGTRNGRECLRARGRSICSIRINNIG